MIGENRAGRADWRGELKDATYGGPTDLWGHGWTVAELNDPGFGVALAVQNTGSAGSEEALVDTVRVIAHVAIPGCGSRECGTDPCTGAPCGTCQAGEACQNDGTCIGPVFADPQSGLQWQNGGEWYHPDPLTGCESLALGGFSDWRLPTLDELRTLVRGCADSAPGGACGVSTACTAAASCGGAACDGCLYGAGPGFGGCYAPSKLRGLPCDVELLSSTRDGSSPWGIDLSTARVRVVGNPSAAFVRCVR